MILPDTQECLSERRRGTLRETCLALGLPEKDAGLLSDILRGVHTNVSDDAENRVRVALGRAPKPKVYQLPECPSCGGAPHTGDCHGKIVERVVILTPGEKVRAPRKPPTRWADYTVSALAQAIRARRPYNLWATVLLVLVVAGCSPTTTAYDQAGYASCTGWFCKAEVNNIVYDGSSLALAGALICLLAAGAVAIIAAAASNR